MSSERKASWIRRVFLFVLIAAAAAGGYFFSAPGPGEKEKPEKCSTATEVTKQNIAEVQGKPGVLTVTNMRLDGNPDPEKLQEILEKLKQEKYGEKVQLAELNVKAEPEIAAAAGVVNLEEFAGHLDFHSAGRKLGDLAGETDPQVVEATIDRMLAGLVRRIDKNWLPDVPGMQRDRGQPVIEVLPAKKSAGAAR